MLAPGHMTALKQFEVTMAGFDDLPFPSPTEGDISSMGDEQPGRAFLAKLREPLVALSLLTIGFFAADFILHGLCSAGSSSCEAGVQNGRTLLTLGALVGAGFLLREAFSAYLFPRTRAIAAAIACLPAAHLLAVSHGVPAPQQVAMPAEPAVDLAPVEAALVEAQADRDRLTSALTSLEARLAEAEAEAAADRAALEERLSSQAALTLADVETAAADAAAKLLAEEEREIEAKLEAQQNQVISKLAAQRARQTALAAVGPRIAAAGPVERVDAETLPAELPRDLEILADHLQLNEQARAELVNDEELQSCITVRKGERGAFQVMGHRMNPDRYAAFLAGCWAR